MRHPLTSLSLILVGSILGSMHGAVHAAENKAPALHYDHYNPVVLNEFALQKYREGDVSSALILLERAHLLAPEDARILRNLNMLHALRDGKRLNDDTLTATAVVSEEDSKETKLPDIEELPVQSLWKRPNDSR